MSNSIKQCSKPGCKNPGTKVCGSCKSIPNALITYYCGRECQLAHWPEHKTMCHGTREKRLQKAKDRAKKRGNRPLPMLGSDWLPQMALKEVFPNGDPRSYLHCLHCKNPCSTCSCYVHRVDDGYFVLPRIDDSMSMDKRLKRWTLLVEAHPLNDKKTYPAKRYLCDSGQKLVPHLEHSQAIITPLMEAYKTSSMVRKLAKKMNVDKAQYCLGCDLAMLHFFSGMWGHITGLGWSMLQNAIQMSDPTDFSGEDNMTMQTTFEIINLNLDTMSYVTQGLKNPTNWKLEDFREE